MGEELRDDQWAVIEPLLPQPKRRGRRRADDRRTLNRIPSARTGSLGAKIGGPLEGLTNQVWQSFYLPPPSPGVAGTGGLGADLAYLLGSPGSAAN
jgi:hypothetical protein